MNNEIIAPEIPAELLNRELVHVSTGTVRLNPADHEGRFDPSDGTRADSILSLVEGFIKIADKDPIRVSFQDVLQCEWQFTPHVHFRELVWSSPEKQNPGRR